MKLFLLLTPLLFTSCVSVTKIHDEQPIPVTFDKAKTAQTFYQGHFLPKSQSEFKAERGTLSIGLGLPFHYSQRDTTQKKFNSAIRLADTNKDGTLTQREVTNYQATQ